MKALIKCHVNYLISKKVIYILLFVIIVCIFIFIINASSLDESNPYQLNNIQYFELSFLTIKTIAAFLTSFLYCNMLSAKNNQYYYFISFYVSRIKFLFTKMLTVLLLELVLIVIIYLFYHISGYILFSKYVYSGKSTIYFFNIFVLMQFYGLFALAVYQVLKNSYVVLVSFSAYILSMIINEEQTTLASTANMFLPSLTEKGVFYYGTYHIILIILLLIGINSLIYIKSDL